MLRHTIRDWSWSWHEILEVGQGQHFLDGNNSILSLLIDEQTIREYIWLTTGIAGLLLRMNGHGLPHLSGAFCENPAQHINTKVIKLVCLCYTFARCECEG